MKVIDFGAPLGGWLRVVATSSLSTDGNQHVISIDHLEMDVVSCVVITIIGLFDPKVLEKLVEMLGGEPDIVVSNMAYPTTTDYRHADRLHIMHLCKAAAEFAILVLKVSLFSNR